jgi:hypothetical protein
MKKLQITLMIVLSLVFFTNGATAQNKPLACQTEAAAGLTWESGRWITKSFLTPKFILVQAGKTLTTDSVSKAINSPATLITCRNVDPQIECTDTSGGALLFNPSTLSGGISQLLGGTTLSTRRDTVTVQVFSCTPF